MSSKRTKRDVSAVPRRAQNAKSTVLSTPNNGDSTSDAKSTSSVKTAANANTNANVVSQTLPPQPKQTVAVRKRSNPMKDKVNAVDVIDLTPEADASAVTAKTAAPSKNNSLDKANAVSDPKNDSTAVSATPTLLDGEDSASAVGDATPTNDLSASGTTIDITKNGVSTGNLRTETSTGAAQLAVKVNDHDDAKAKPDLTATQTQSKQASYQLR